MKEEKLKISIIGVGLLGGSLALALKGKKKYRLMGWNHRASSRRKAAKILAVAPTFEKAIQGADIIVLCAHSGSMTGVLRRMKKDIGGSTLVMDVSSVKGAVVREAEALKGMEKNFVPCHPMAGKEKSGPLNADKTLYQEKVVFITPLPKNPPALVQRTVRFWREAGAVPVLLKASDHDRYVALTSHLPHLLACAVMTLYGKKRGHDPKIEKAVGSGFRDFTRIAGGSPAMWSDIVKLNGPEIRRVLSEFRGILGSFEKKLSGSRSAGWKGFFKKARSLREKL